MDFRAFKARKLEVLTEKETISSFTGWKQNIEFHLASVNDFAPFLVTDFEWKIPSVNNRGLTDGTSINAKTAVQKLYILEHMIGLIVSYCPETIRLEIQRKCTSLKWIWNRVRRHYGFNKSEVNFLKLATIKYSEGERYEAFFQRIMAHLYDNLLTAESGITFDGEEFRTNEEMSPSTERLAVFLWLHYIDERLPMYIARVYSHDLQRKSLKDLQPVISQNMDSLLVELSAQEDIKLAYTSGTYNNRQKSFKSQPRGTTKRFANAKTCAFGKACKKTFTGHDVSSCWSLSRFDKEEIVKALKVHVDEEIDQEEEELIQELSIGNRVQALPSSSSSIASISRVEIMRSPTFHCHHNNFPCIVIISIQ